MENNLKKIAITTLLNGGMIAYRSRVLDKNSNPIVKITENMFNELKPMLRKNKLVYLINKSEVRRQHGNTFIKKQYKKLKQS